MVIVGIGSYLGKSTHNSYIQFDSLYCVYIIHKLSRTFISVILGIILSVEFNCTVSAKVTIWEWIAS